MKTKIHRVLNQSVDIERLQKNKMSPQLDMFKRFKELGTLKDKRYNMGKRVLVLDKTMNGIL